MMELIELMSPHVAMPVIGVLFCAVMVFAFGFRSPVQPPSFNFEEQEKRNSKKRVKTVKVKAPSNGHAVINEPPAEETPASKPVKETKNVSSPKMKSADLKLNNKKDKQEPKTENKRERAEKKRQLVKEEAKKEGVVTMNKDMEDDGGWTTALSKKGKKQKSVTKKDAAAGDSWDNEPEVAAPVVEAAAAASPAAASPAVASPEVEEPGSPQANKSKKKKKTPGKGKLEEKEEPVASVETKPTAEIISEIAPTEESGESKKKKNKKNKNSNAAAAVGAAAASPSENLPQDAAPASAKSVKKEASPAPVSSPAPVPVVDDGFQVKLSPKKKKGKAKDKESPVLEVKSEKPAAPEIKPVEKAAEPVKKQTEKKKPASPAPAVKVEAAASKEPTPAAPKSSDASAEAPPTSISFDEIGDSWQEAAPKSKKKKPRRDN